VYPTGHPFLLRSAETVMSRLDTLLLEREAISFGVARLQLVIEGVATDAHNPVLSGLAGRLHRHRVGAVTLARGATAEEVSAFLTLLSVDVETGGPVLGNEASGAVGWEHIQLHPLSYAQLELSGAEASAELDDPHAARLWIGLARAAVSARGDVDMPTPEPGMVAHAINHHPQAVAYDQVIVGHLLQLANELRHGDGRGTLEVRRRLSQMIAGLNPATLRRLVEMGGDEGQRRRFLIDASHGFTAESIIKLVEAAADASEQSVSHSLLRILSKLATHAEVTTTRSGAVAQTALRDQVKLLTEGWSLADPNPDAYTRTLEQLSHTSSGTAGTTYTRNTPEPERIVQTALEVDAAGPTAWAAVKRMIDEEALPFLVDLLHDAPRGSRFAAEVWEVVSTPESVKFLLGAGVDALTPLDRLCRRMGDAVVAPLVEALMESEQRVVRRAAVDRLAAMGAAAAAEVVKQLDDPRWYVVRNLLLVLQEAGPWPAGFSPSRFIRDEEVKVRREAYKLAFRVPAERPAALAAALADDDVQTIRNALAECAADCPLPVLPAVCRRVDDGGGDPELRILAIRVLANATHDSALRSLLRLVERGRDWLGRTRLAPPSPPMLAALTALAVGWGEHPAARPAVQRALRSEDPEIIRAALALTETR